MELHHKNHHQTYVNSFNAASEQLASAEQKEDIAAQIALQPLINFHGGGHINHSLFWENLAPSKNGGGGEPAGQLKVNSLSHTQLSMSSYIEQFANLLHGRPPSKPATVISPPSRQSSTPHWQVSKAVDGRGSSRTTRLARFRSAHMPIKTQLLENTPRCWVLMLGSMHIICSIRIVRQSTLVRFGMWLTGRRLRRD